MGKEQISQDCSVLGASKGEKRNILIEIMSCWDLLVGDYKSSDPYVKVKLGTKHVHKTKYIPET